MRDKNPGHVSLSGLTGAVTLDAATGTSFSLSLVGNINLTITNLVQGESIDVLFFQDAVGGRTVTYVSPISFPGQATALAPAAGANAITGMRLFNAGANPGQDRIATSGKI